MMKFIRAYFYWLAEERYSADIDVDEFTVLTDPDPRALCFLTMIICFISGLGSWMNYTNEGAMSSVILSFIFHMPIFFGIVALIGDAYLHWTLKEVTGGEQTERFPVSSFIFYDYDIPQDRKKVSWWMPSFYVAAAFSPFFLLGGILYYHPIALVYVLAIIAIFGAFYGIHRVIVNVLKMGYKVKKDFHNHKKNPNAHGKE